MKQSRLMSMLEAVLSTAAGFGISLLAQIFFLPLIGVAISLSQNVTFAVIMTFVSLARQFVLRRLFEALHIRVPMSAFATAVLRERLRQKTDEGWDDAHDDAHEKGELAAAGAVYALGTRQGAISDPRKLGALLYFTARVFWPWESAWMKITTDERRNLVKSAALIIAEGEKFDRSRKTKKRAF